MGQLLTGVGQEAQCFHFTLGSLMYMLDMGGLQGQALRPLSHPPPPPLQLENHF